LRILLANPPPARRIQHHDQGFMPFLGLGYLAAATRARGHEVRVADCRLARLDLTELVDAAREFKPGVVGLSAMTHEIPQAYASARALAAVLPGVHLALGGAHTTALPARTLEECPELELVCFGEGEHTLAEALDVWSAGDAITSCPGAAWRDGSGAIQVGPMRDWEQDLDRLPFPAWDLFPRSATYPIMTARGCQYRCNFCCRALGGAVRKRSVANVLEELEWVIRTFRPRLVRFEDETLTLDRDHAHALLDGIIERGYHRLTRFNGQTRVDRVDLETLRKLKRANFAMLEMGVESGSPAVLEASDKRITLDRVRESFRLAREVGIPTFAKFILGHPNETHETIRQTVDLATELNPERVSFAIMVPYPGTRVWEYASAGQAGYRLISAGWSDFDKFLGNTLELEQVPRSALEKWQIRGYATVYLRNHRYADFAGLVWRHRKSAIGLLRKLASARLDQARPPAQAERAGP
jgi:anaerobic magnesium-protoporphyrin IX monomethyl ester cyclase